MSIFLLRHPAVATVALALLLGACSTAPKQASTPAAEAAQPESNEPDLVAQLRERMATGNLQRKTRAEQAGSTAATGDTSSAPRVTIDPALRQAAQTVAADYARATGLVQAGNDAEALALLRNIATRAPRLAGPRLNQALILLRQDKATEAEAVLRDVLKTNPTSPFAHNLLGITLRQQGKFADARAAYTTALEIDPNYARAHFNLGVLLDLYLQELPQALAHYERYQALQARPDAAVANWIVDLQKRTGVYKASPRPAPAPAPADDSGAMAPGAAGNDTATAPASTTEGSAS